MAVGEKNWVRHWEVHVRMDLSKIMNIQDGFLQNKADLFDCELTHSATPNTTRRKKIQASPLSNCKIRMNEDKKFGCDPSPSKSTGPWSAVGGPVRPQHSQAQPSAERGEINVRDHTKQTAKGSTPPEPTALHCMGATSCCLVFLQQGEMHRKRP